MVEQKQKSYTTTTPMGHEINVIPMSKDDVERKIAEFEAKYGMTSAEFAAKWNRGELDCAVMDYFEWEGYCDYMAEEHDVRELKINHHHVQELRID